MYPRQIDQRGQNFGLKTNAIFALTKAPTQNQCLEIFDTVLVAPKPINGHCNANVVLRNHGHFLINPGLQWTLMKRHRARRQVIFLPTQGWKSRFLKFGIFGFLHQHTPLE